MEARIFGGIEGILLIMILLFNMRYGDYIIQKDGGKVKAQKKENRSTSSCNYLQSGLRTVALPHWQNFQHRW